MSLKLLQNWDFGLKMDMSKIVRSQSMMAVDIKGSGNGSQHPSIPEDQPLKAGWLKKQRSIVKNWQQRYFVLKRQCLYYYKDEDDLKHQGWVPLHGSTIKEVAASPEEGGKFIFEIIPQSKNPLGDQNRGGPDSYVLMASSQLDMEEWVRLLRKAIGAPLGVVFGQQLMETMAYEQRFGQHLVPILVEKCAEFIRKKGLNEEGIFRLPGQDNLVKQLREAFDAGERPSFDQGTDVHTVASLFKLYLRELPEPLIPCSQYEDFLLCGQLLMASEAKGHQQLVKQLAVLPRDNYNLLTYICRFLHEIQQHSTTNKMNVDNLATVFGVNLIRPRVEDPVIIMKGTPHIHKVMTAMISNHIKLFPESRDVAPSLPLQKSDSKKTSVLRSTVGWDVMPTPLMSKAENRSLWQAKDDIETAGSKHLSRTESSGDDKGELPPKDARKRTQTLPNRRCFTNIAPNRWNQSVAGKDVSSSDFCASSSSSSLPSSSSSSVHPNPVGHKRTLSHGLSKLFHFPQPSDSNISQDGPKETGKQTQRRENPLLQISDNPGKGFQANETPSLRLNGGISPNPLTDNKDSHSEDPELLRKMVAELKKELEMQKKDFDQQINSLQKENYEVWTKVMRLNEETEKEKKKSADLELELQSLRCSMVDLEKKNKLLEDSIKSLCQSARKTD